MSIAMPHDDLKRLLLLDPLSAGRMLFARVDEPQGDDEEFVMLEPEEPPHIPPPGPRQRGEGIEVDREFLVGVEFDYGGRRRRAGYDPHASIRGRPDVRKWLDGLAAGAEIQSRERSL